MPTTSCPVRPSTPAAVTTNEISGETHQLQVTTSYDADGNPIGAEAVDLTGDDQTRTATLRYDEHNRVIRMTDAEGAETSFGYDRFGNRTRMVDPSGVQYEYAYTARNTIAEVRLRGWTGDPDWIPPEDSTTPWGYLVLASYAYGLNGELARATDAMGRTTRYTYWGDGLLKDTIAATSRAPMAANATCCCLRTSTTRPGTSPSRPPWAAASPRSRPTPTGRLARR